MASWKSHLLNLSVTLYCKFPLRRIHYVILAKARVRCGTSHLLRSIPWEQTIGFAAGPNSGKFPTVWEINAILKHLTTGNLARVRERRLWHRLQEIQLAYIGHHYAAIHECFNACFCFISLLLGSRRLNASSSKHCNECSFSSTLMWLRYFSSMALSCSTEFHPFQRVL